MSAGGGARAGWSAELESLRGIAIALVVLFHARAILGMNPAVERAAPSLLAAFVLAGHTGVTLFFVLSGYLLAPAFIAEARGGVAVDRLEFFARRALRVLPLYYLFVALGSVVTASAPTEVLRGLPYLFFLNAWPLPDLPRNLFPWSSVWWSLATEVQFYLLLPLLALAGRGRFGRQAIAGLFALYAAAYVFAVSGGLESWPALWRTRLFASVFGRGPAFALGAIAATATPALRGWFDRHPDSWVRRWLIPDLLVVMVVCSLGALLRVVATVGYEPMELDHNAWHIAEALLAGSLVLLMDATPLRGKLLLSNPILGALGRWSYSLYLIHYPVIAFTYARGDGILRHSAIPKPLGAALVLVTAVALSAASYHFYERRFLRGSQARGPALQRESSLAT